MNVKQLKEIISECMSELKESYPVGMPPMGPSGHQTAMGLGSGASAGVNPELELDGNVKKQNWSELINTCVHDPHSKFLETYFIPALSANRETIGAILEALAENEDVQNEIYKALDEFEYKE